MDGSGWISRFAVRAGALVVASIVVTGCGLATSSGAPGTPGFDRIEGTRPLQDAAADKGASASAEINDFGFDLFRHLDSKGNLCVSPTSIALALAMVEPGARGQTATEMATVLHSFGQDDGAEIAALIESLRMTDSTVELDVADQAFIQKGLEVMPDYLDALSSSFGAGVGLLDFKANSEAARQTINQWASAHTKGRIPEILKPGDVSSMTRLALANAIYLKSDWATKFEGNDTYPADFTTASGSKVSVPTMNATLTILYAEGAGYRAIDLPLQSGLSMTVVVPDDMASFVADLSSTRLAAVIAAEKDAKLGLALPKFSIDTRFSLADTLAAMGMPTVFSDAADLTGISTQEPLLLSKVIHQANIDVTEGGITAAAVTVAEIELAAAMPQGVEFRADRPFLYFVHTAGPGAILFMGRVDDPSAK